MAKTKTAFFCQNCGAQYSKWQGQCYACKEWNTIVEEVIQKKEKHQWKKEDEQDDTPRSRKTNKYVPLHEITTEKEMRLDSGDQELNNVLGGGIVPGSVVLIGGEPGIGKSTLLLQIAMRMPYKTLYVSGEESQKQIKMRGERITNARNNCYILTETKTQNIFQQIKDLDPEILIIDSI